MINHTLGNTTQLATSIESDNREMPSLMDDVDLEDFDLNQIINYSHENGVLTSLCELKFGEIVPVPFDQLRHDHPHGTANTSKKR